MLLICHVSFLGYVDYRQGSHLLLGGMPALNAVMTAVQELSAATEWHDVTAVYPETRYAAIGLCGYLRPGWIRYGMRRGYDVVGCRIEHYHDSSPRAVGDYRMA
jgi:hypothetical protein